MKFSGHAATARQGPHFENDWATVITAARPEVKLIPPSLILNFPHLWPAFGWSRVSSLTQTFLIKGPELLAALPLLLPLLLQLPTHWYHEAQKWHSSESRGLQTYPSLTPMIIKVKISTSITAPFFACLSTGMVIPKWPFLGSRFTPPFPGSRKGPVNWVQVKAFPAPWNQNLSSSWA